MKLLLRASVALLCTFHVSAQEPVRVDAIASERTREAISEAATFVAVIQGGRLLGFQAFGVQPDSLFHRIGLRQQEVIVAVNGEAATPADIYAAMQSAGVVEFRVQSASGAQRTLTFELVEK